MALLLSNLVMCFASEMLVTVYSLFAFTPIESGMGVSFKCAAPLKKCLLLNRRPLILREPDRSLPLPPISYSDRLHVPVPTTSATQMDRARLARMLVPVGHGHLAYHRCVLPSPQFARTNGSAGWHARVGIQVQHDPVLHCVGLWRILLDVSDNNIRLTP